MCACRTGIETVEHFLLRCQFYSTQPNFLSLSANNQVFILMYGSQTISKNLKKFLQMWYPTLLQILVLIDHWFLTNENCFIVGFSKMFFLYKLDIYLYLAKFLILGNTIYIHHLYKTINTYPISLCLVLIILRKNKCKHHSNHKDQIF